jgi:hypothetical protein
MRVIRNMRRTKWTFERVTSFIEIPNKTVTCQYYKSITDATNSFVTLPAPQSKFADLFWNSSEQRTSQHLIKVHNIIIF